MGNLNLQALIDQVLGITREAWDMKKRKLDDGLSGHEQTVQRNNKIDDELLRQRGAQELQAQGNEASLARQGLVNTGNLDVQKERTAGEIARQGLVNEGDRYKTDQQLWGEIYKTDVGAKSAKFTGDAASITAAATVAGNQTLSDPQRQQALDFLNFHFGRAQQPAPKAEAVAAPAATPAATPAALPTPAAPAEVKVGPLDFDKPDDVPGTKSAGRKSMEFRDPTSTDPAAAAAAKKKSEERLLYGTKPQRRGWF